MHQNRQISLFSTPAKLLSNLAPCWTQMLPLADSCHILFGLRDIFLTGHSVLWILWTMMDNFNHALLCASRIMSVRQENKTPTVDF